MRAFLRCWFRLPVDLGGVGAEDVLEGAEALGAEFVAVADEQGAAELAGVGDALEQVDGDEGLARSRWPGTAARAWARRRACSGRSSPGRRGSRRPGSSGGCLRRRRSAEQGPGGRGFEAEAHGLLIAGAKFAPG